MISIFVLSFQGPTGGLVFPLRGVSLTWFDALFGQARTGDVGGAFSRSLPLALIALVLTVIISVSAGLAFRKRFIGSGFIFYSAVASLIVPGLVLSIGILVTFKFTGLPARWYSSALGAHLSWTLPFGLLIMFAVLSRLNPSYEEAARDLGASPWKVLSQVIVPIVFPGIIAVALFGFTLSYDEFPRSWLTVGPEEHPANRDLDHDHDRNVTGALRSGDGDHRNLLRCDLPGLGLDRAHPASPAAPGRRPAMTHSGEIELVRVTKRFGAAGSGQGDRSDHPRRLLLLSAWAQVAAARPRSCA